MSKKVDGFLVSWQTLYYICCQRIIKMKSKAEHTDMLVIRFPKEYADLKAELRQIYEQNKDGERSFNEFVVNLLANAKMIFQD